MLGFKIAAASIAGIFLFTCVCPRQALAARSEAGGGELEEFDIERVLTSVGISIGIAYVGSLISSTWNAATTAANAANTAEKAVETAEKIEKQLEAAEKAGEALEKIEKLERQAAQAAEAAKKATEVASKTSVLKGAWEGAKKAMSLKSILSTVRNAYNTYVATYQVARLIGAMGAYYDWSNRTTYILTLVACAAVAGFLNPESSTGRDLDTQQTVYTDNPQVAEALGGEGAIDTTNLSPEYQDMVQSMRDSGMTDAQINRGLTVQYGSDWTNYKAYSITPTPNASYVVQYEPNASATKTYLNNEGIQYSSGTMPTVSPDGVTLQSTTTVSSSGITSELTVGGINSANVIVAPARTISVLQRLEGAAIGAMGGAAYGGAVVAIDGDKIDDDDEDTNPGVGAQIAGIVAGELAMNLGRTVFNPATYDHKTLGTYQSENKTEVQKTAAANNTDTYDFTKENYYKVTDVSTDGIAKVDQNTTLNSEFDYEHLSPRYQYQQSAPGRITVTDTQADLTAGEIALNIGRGTFLTTAQNWPSLAAQSVGVYAASRITDEDDEKWKPLVSGLAQAVTQPIFSGTQMMVDWTNPSLYFGDNQDIIQARIEHAHQLRTLGLDNKSNEVYEALSVEGGAVDRLESDLARIDEMPASTTEQIQARQAEIDAACSRYLNQAAKDTGVDRKVLEKGFWKPSATADLVTFDPKQVRDNLVSASNVADTRAMKAELEHLARSTEPTSWADVIRNRTISEMRRFYSESPRHLGNTNGLEAGLESVGTSRWELFANSVGQNWRSGIFSATVSGLASAGMSSFTDANKNSSLTQIAGSYAANQLSAAVTGIAQYYGWNHTTNKWDWNNHLDFVMPTQYTVSPLNSDGSRNPNFNYVQFKLDQSSYSDQLQNFWRFAALNNCDPGTFNRYTGKYHGGTNMAYMPQETWILDNSADGGHWDTEHHWIAYAHASDQHPSLAFSVATNMAQANQEYLAGLLSFGAPIMRDSQDRYSIGLRPEQISPQTFMSYVFNSDTSLTSLAQAEDGIEGVITTLATEANKNSIANRWTQTFLQIPYVALVTHMRPERLVMRENLTVVDEPLAKYTYDRNTYERMQIAWNAGDYSVTVFDGYRNPQIHEKWEEGDFVKNPYYPEYARMDFIPESKLSYSDDLALGLYYQDPAQSWTYRGTDNIDFTQTVGTQQLLTHELSNDAILQTLSYGSGAPLLNVTFWSPYPNPMYSPASQTGPIWHLQNNLSSTSLTPALPPAPSNTPNMPDSDLSTGSSYIAGTGSSFDSGSMN